MFMKNLTKIIAITIFAVSAQAVAATAESAADGHPYYQCSSHHTDDDFRIHYGLPSATECEAQESAVKVCEDYEKHKCEVHDCRYFLQ